MSKLEQLINELCPDGVEYRPLKELFDLKNGYTPSKAKEEYWKNGTIPWFRMEDLRLNGNILSYAIQKVNSKGIKGKLFPKNSIIMATTATIGEHALILTDYICNQQFTSFTVKEEIKKMFDIKFIFYYFFLLDNQAKQSVNTSSFPSVQMNELKKLLIPLPPLPVQEEIVRILDTFTELTAELTTELTLRKKQYEYYREKLLTFGDEVEWKTLSDILKIKNGKDYKQFKEGKVPVYGSGGIMTYIETSISHKPSVLIPRKGSINKLYYVDTPFWTVDTIFYTEINTEIVVPKFVFYYLQKEHLEKYNTAGGVPSLTQAILNKIIFPVPSLEEQLHIVDILDRFDTLVNDIKEGLPAEIEARQKQYEYYRDKLLTFKKLEKID